MAPKEDPYFDHGCVGRRRHCKLVHADCIGFGDGGVIQGAEGECVTGGYLFEKQMVAGTVTGGRGSVSAVAMVRSRTLE